MSFCSTRTVIRTDISTMEWAIALTGLPMQGGGETWDTLGPEKRLYNASGA